MISKRLKKIEVHSKKNEIKEIIVLTRIKKQIRPEQTQKFNEFQLTNMCNAESSHRNP